VSLLKEVLGALTQLTPDAAFSRALYRGSFQLLAVVVGCLGYAAARVSSCR